MEIELIVFDLDGVLVDSSQCHALAYNDLWESCGVTGPDYQNIAGKTTREVLETYTADLNFTDEYMEELVHFKQKRARDYLLSEMINFDDVLPCLRMLKEHDITLAIGTGASRETTKIILNQLTINNFFSVVVTGDDVCMGKPAPEIYNKVITLAGKSSEKTLVIEDSITGLKAAVASGARVISIRTGVTIVSPVFLGSFFDLKSAIHELGLMTS